MAVCSLLAMSVSCLLDTEHRKIICDIVFILLCIYVFYKKLFIRKTADYLLEECNPDAFLSVRMALYSYVRKTSKYWCIHFFNIVSALFYTGRFDDAEKVIPCILRCRQNDETKMIYEMFCAQQSFVRNDIGELNQHITNLKALGPVTKLKKLILRLFYQETMQYQL